MNIQKILNDNGIVYIKECEFPDLKNKKPLRFDFAILDNDKKIVRLIEFDGIQHYKKQQYFTHSLEETQESDKIKNNYCKINNIPLVRIPYWERDNITLNMLLGDDFLID